MALPYSRNRTYVPASVDKAGAQVKSSDLNDFQDQIVALAAATESLVRLSMTLTTNVSVSNANTGAVKGYPYPMMVSPRSSSAGHRFLNNASAFSTVTVPNFANGIASAWGSCAAMNGSGLALSVVDSSSSIATRLARFDGTSWATADLPAAYSGNARVAWIGSSFYVAQANGTVYKSTTGATGSWTTGTSLPANTDYRHLDVVAEGGGIAVGVRGNQDGSNGYVLRTADGGTSWTAVLLPGTSPTVAGITYDGRKGRFLACGTANSVAAIWSSTDGTTWTLSAPTISGITAPTFLGNIVSNGSGFLLSSQTCVLFSSTDPVQALKYVPSPIESADNCQLAAFGSRFGVVPLASVLVHVSGQF